MVWTYKGKQALPPAHAPSTLRCCESEPLVVMEGVLTPGSKASKKKPGRGFLAPSPSSASSSGSRPRSPSPNPIRPSSGDSPSSFPDSFPLALHDMPSDDYSSPERRAATPTRFDRSPSPLPRARPEASPGKRRSRDSPSTPQTTPSPSPSRSRKRRTSGLRPSALSDDAYSSDEEAVMPDALEFVNSSSLLLAAPQEVQLRILEMLGPAVLGKLGGCCRYLASITQVVWMALAKKRYPSVRSTTLHLSLIRGLACRALTPFDQSNSDQASVWPSTSSICPL